MVSGRRRLVVVAAAAFIILVLWRGFAWPAAVVVQRNGSVYSSRPADNKQRPQPGPSRPSDGGTGGETDNDDGPVYNENFLWRTLPYQNPVTSFRPLPTGTINMALGQIQPTFHLEGAPERQERLTRQDSVRDAFLKCWDSYKARAWLHDELSPLTGEPKDTFGGWGATLIDSLDTLWIMDLKDEFEEAVDAVDKHVSFESTPSEEINVFETNIRFLGGLIAAYDLSGDNRLLTKAVEAGDMLYRTFDTPNHMPVMRWNTEAAARGAPQLPDPVTLLAEIGSMSLEFTRLSLITGDPKYYDAVQRIAELFQKAQMSTKIPGLWPIQVDAAAQNFDSGNTYSLGGMSDSMYEYLPKMLALIGDGDSIYRDMYIRSVTSAEQSLFFRPMTTYNLDILFPGTATATRSTAKEPVDVQLEPSVGHLGCFTGGMLALGGRLISDDHHVEMGARLSRGCIWAYESMQTHIMPEVSLLTACENARICVWNEGEYLRAVGKAHASDDKISVDPMSIIREEHLPNGFVKVVDGRYILRPEAVESVFVMYRVTGDKSWARKAWSMWQAIDDLTFTELGNAAILDVNPKGGKSAVEKLDSMESFWMGETLKYLYLTFSEPNLINLNEWVFNTEAHPFRRRNEATKKKKQ